MTIDIVCGAILLMLSFLGWRSGLIQQVIRVVAAIAAIFGSPFVATIVREIWAQETEIAPPMSEAFSLGVAAILIYFAITLAGWLAVRTMHAASDTLTDMDRNLGAVVGAVKGLIIVYLIASVFILAMIPLERNDPNDKFHLRDGHLLPLVEEYNIILPWQFPHLDEFHFLIRVARKVEDEKLHEKVRNDTKVADMLRKDIVKKMASDDGLMKAARDEFYPRSIADPRVREFLNDEKNVDEMKDVKWDILLKELGGDGFPIGDEKAAEGSTNGATPTATD